MSELNQNNVTGTSAEVRRVGQRGAVACFVAGTRILTVQGQRPVEHLVPGDRVMTRDNGLQTVRWVGCRHMDITDREFADVRPLRISAGALGGGMPDRDMLVSPDHRVFLAEKGELVIAKDLLGRDGIAPEEVKAVIYYHVLFDEAVTVLTEGSWSEGFVDVNSAIGLDAVCEEEIIAFFPELRILPSKTEPTVDPLIAMMLAADAGLETVH